MRKAYLFDPSRSTNRFNDDLMLDVISSALVLTVYKVRQTLSIGAVYTGYYNFLRGQPLGLMVNLRRHVRGQGYAFILKSTLDVCL